ncbi:hypothetical protein EYZ11_001555 [Aspergillus tanneri]|uniref:Uncharacterized protein n=1 Tax=Aspergillus tanneri TaxID=1220188 RepID=A0A4S3JUD8_9EURO|nr:uncharacterized protein ATNIH1004_007572 [Aspergillus tanneri]KAA8646146.1 hypothetical protein ATNIH1004_007572 [Aspergillus tanneri]THC99004.1 hypothetical protein EYZ11_001555 [Aspergillus tanneri]
MAITPPPPSTLRMPPTPQHGAGYDQYEPYSTRQSARLANQRRLKEPRSTPPPTLSPPPAYMSSKKSKKQSNESKASPPPRPAYGSPRKIPSSRVRDIISSETIMDGMLPTPAKTPRKKAVGDAGSTARTLFPPPPTSGSARGKKGKKPTPFSLDSFSEDNAQGGSQIQIYTDSRDRIPEVDESEANPFYKKPMASNPCPRTLRRRYGGRDKEVDEAIKRDDGMVYVFRGKKTFRKFSDAVESDQEEEDDGDLGLLAARPDLIDSSYSADVRPLTRSSIKPRVLFPSANDRTPREVHGEDTDEEEAATDIEDHEFTEDVDSSDHVSDTDMEQRPVTPPLNDTSEISSSPGATVRALRSRAKRGGLEPSGTPPASQTKKKRASPFDGWLRKKQTPAYATATKAKKRDAEPSSTPGGPVPKKTRGNRLALS